MSPYVAEMIGTALLILLGNGVVAGVLLKKSKAENAGWIVITMGWGLAVAVAAYSVGGFSGAHLNPALTIGLAVADKFQWSLVPGYILAQVAGAFLGSVLVWLHYLPHWKVTEDAGAKLAIFATGPAIRNTPANLISEVIGTFVLVLAIMAIGGNQLADGLGPFVVGFLVVVIGLSLGGTTGYAINPARDLGPRIAHAILPIAGKGSSDWRYALVPIIGPIIGGVLASVFYTTIFVG